ncbi:MAG TPA: DUF3667 domain-containing protein, partial [Segetibacter sp.]
MKIVINYLNLLHGRFFYAASLSSPHMQQTNCLNCGDELPEGKNFCASCGQKTETHRLTLHEILHEALHAITHADKGFFYLVKELAIRPGAVAREYIEGRRKRYFNPYSFLVIVTGVLVLVSSNLRIFGYSSSEQPKLNITKGSPQEIEAKKAFLKRTAQFTDFVNNHSNIVLFISTPFLAFMFWLMYKKKKLFYAEHLTAMVFFNSFLMIATALIFAPLIYITRNQHMYGTWLSLMLLTHVLYFAYAYKQLF